MGGTGAAEMRGMISLVLAASLSILDNGVSRTIDCAGREIVVSGNRADLELTGDCPSVVVNGNRNQVSIAKAVRVRVLGNENEVSWSAGAPRVSDLGRANSVVGAEEGASAEDHVINGSGLVKTVDCTGASLTVNGASNVLDVKGPCKTITVTGAMNRVTFQSAERVVVSGASNEVRWPKSARPKVVETGLANDLRPEDQ